MDEIAAKLKAARKRSKVLLDLRDCSEGDAAEGLRLANFFINQGTLATLEGQKFPPRPLPPIRQNSSPALRWPCSSTAEPMARQNLTADAIEGSKRGDVVGERTFGEGSVQKTIELPDGAALLLTVAKYEGPDGKKIQDDAVTPKVVVGQASEDEIDAEDARAQQER